MLDRLFRPLPFGPSPATLVWCLLTVSMALLGWAIGHQQAAATGEAELQTLRAAYSQQALHAAQQSLQQLAAEATRAQQAEAALLAARDQHAKQVQQLKERIAHVTTVYRPAPAAAPVAIPRCVLTAGWLRDFNLALGAGMPASGEGAATASTAAATWPAPGADAELLESGVTPADVLAYAQDYGRWARSNLDQLNALLGLHRE